MMRACHHPRRLLVAAAVILVPSASHADIADLLDPRAAATQDRLRDSIIVAAPLALPDDIADTAIDPAQYIVGPGDRLAIVTWGASNAVRTVIVSPEGDVLVPGAGVISVGGRTLREARTAVESAVRSQIRGSRVSVQLEGVRRFKVYVTGAVQTPGVVRATAALRVSEVIARAGGLADGAARRGIRLTHVDGGEGVVDLAGFMQAGRIGGNPFVREGDIVFVPRRGPVIDVQGAVQTTGLVDLQADDSLSTAIALAGGALPGAILERVEYHRVDAAGRRTGPFFADLTTPGGRAIPLQDGDRVFVRRMADWNRVPLVTLSGQVRYPGQYAIDQGTTLDDVLTRAGGVLADADSGAISIDRAWPRTPTEQELRGFDVIDASRMRNEDVETMRQVLAGRPGLVSIDLAARPADRATRLREGDDIRVPRAVGQIRIAGEVRRPGLIDYAAGRSLDEYVRDAGGYTSRADHSHVRVGKLHEWHTVAAKDAQPLRQGDVVWVPQKAPSQTWAHVRDTIAVAAQLVTIYLVIQNNNGSSN